MGRSELLILGVNIEARFIYKWLDFWADGLLYNQVRWDAAKAKFMGGLI
jgi:hypothetical protein